MCGPNPRSRAHTRQRGPTEAAPVLARARNGIHEERSQSRHNADEDGETNLVQAEFNYVSAVAEFQRSTATEIVYNNQFDTTARPTTLTAVEAQKAARSRRDSPLDPDKPATHKSKQISLIPPAGKVDTGSD